MPRSFAFAAAALLVALPTAAQARFHLWFVNEVFSNDDGSIQFVELTTDTDFQDLIDAHEIEFRSNGSVIATAPFSADLDTTDTADHSLLMATPEFLAASGIEADFEMPVGTIPVAQVDAVRMSGSAPTQFSFTAGSLPLDGVHSLNRSGGSAVATPTNFAGDTGTIVPEPDAGALAVAAWLAMFAVPRISGRERRTN